MTIQIAQIDLYVSVMMYNNGSVLFKLIEKTKN